MTLPAYAESFDFYRKDWEQMEIITVNASQKYDVIIGTSLLENCGEYVKKVTRAEKIALISDDNVSGIYSERVTASLKQAGFEVCLFTFPHGEASKCCQYHWLIEYRKEGRILSLHISRPRPFRQ